MSNTVAYKTVLSKKNKKKVKKKPQIRNMKDLSKSLTGRSRGGRA